MVDFPKRMNLHDITISRLSKQSVQLDPVFKEPITNKIYRTNTIIRAQYLFLYEGSRPLNRTLHGEADEVKGRVTVSRNELLDKGLLTTNTSTKTDTLLFGKGDKIIKLAYEPVDFIIKGVNASGQLQTAGSIPVIYVIYFTEHSEAKSA